MDHHRIVSEFLDVGVNAHGAELTSIRHRDVGELLWPAEAAWPQHAPNLFPIVGQLAGDQLHVDGVSYPLKRHGFARNRIFEWLDADATACRLVLRDDAQTHDVYPFPFALEIGYAVSGATLEITFVIRNTGTKVLPASIGAHPAFRWPLADGIAKDAHTLTFDQPETAPIRRLQDGLLKLERFPTPVDGRVLHLEEALFDADAVVMDEIKSRSVRYHAPGAPAIDVAWRGFSELGIWMKPGAAFLCIEPWHGYASPADFDGPFEAKPGLLLIPPGAADTLTITVSVDTSHEEDA